MHTPYQRAMPFDFALILDTSKAPPPSKTVAGDDSSHARNCMHAPVRGHRDVHPEQVLAHSLVGTVVAHAERRVQLAQQVWEVVVRHTLGPRGVILLPHVYEQIKVLRSQYRLIQGEILEVVHDDGHKEIDDEEGANERESAEVDDRDHGSIGLFPAIVHDVLPRFSRGTPKQHHQRGKKRSKIVVVVDTRVVIQWDFRKQKHSNHSIHEKTQHDEQNDVGQCLERVQKSEEELPHVISFGDNLDHTSNAKQTQKSNVDTSSDNIHETTNHNDKIHHIPVVRKIHRGIVGNQLCHGLKGEDGDKHVVEPLQHILVSAAHPLVLHHELNGVAENRRDNDRFKEF
eukprot:m.1480973 g.1480973  ORF g.1480973 m.1480973 type:complete len:343 (-) comp25172_c0_seq2:4125-5153(-)